MAGRRPRVRHQSSGGGAEGLHPGRQKARTKRKRQRTEAKFTKPYSTRTPSTRGRPAIFKGLGDYDDDDDNWDNDNEEYDPGQPERLRGGKLNKRQLLEQHVQKYHLLDPNDLQKRKEMREQIEHAQKVLFQQQEGLFPEQIEQQENHQLTSVAEMRQKIEQKRESLKYVERLREKNIEYFQNSSKNFIQNFLKAVENPEDVPEMRKYAKAQQKRREQMYKEHKKQQQREADAFLKEFELEQARKRKLLEQMDDNLVEKQLELDYLIHVGDDDASNPKVVVKHKKNRFGQDVVENDDKDKDKDLKKVVGEDHDLDALLYDEDALPGDKSALKNKTGEENVNNADNDNKIKKTPETIKDLHDLQDEQSEKAKNLSYAERVKLKDPYIDDLPDFARLFNKAYDDALKLRDLKARYPLETREDKAVLEKRSKLPEFRRDFLNGTAEQREIALAKMRRVLRILPLDEHEQERLKQHAKAILKRDFEKTKVLLAGNMKQHEKEEKYYQELQERELLYHEFKQLGTLNKNSMVKPPAPLTPLESYKLQQYRKRRDGVIFQPLIAPLDKKPKFLEETDNNFLNFVKQRNLNPAEFDPTLGPDGEDLSDDPKDSPEERERKKKLRFQQEFQQHLKFNIKNKKNKIYHTTSDPDEVESDGDEEDEIEVFEDSFDREQLEKHVDGVDEKVKENYLVKRRKKVKKKRGDFVKQLRRRKKLQHEDEMVKIVRSNLGYHRGSTKDQKILLLDEDGFPIHSPESDEAFDARFKNKSPWEQELALLAQSFSSIKDIPKTIRHEHYASKHFGDPAFDTQNPDHRPFALAAMTTHSTMFKKITRNRVKQPWERSSRTDPTDWSVFRDDPTKFAELGLTTESSIAPKKLWQTVDPKTKRRGVIMADYDYEFQTPKVEVAESEITLPNGQVFKIDGRLIQNKRHDEAAEDQFKGRKKRSIKKDEERRLELFLKEEEIDSRVDLNEQEKHHEKRKLWDDYNNLVENLDENGNEIVRDDDVPKNAEDDDDIIKNDVNPELDKFGYDQYHTKYDMNHQYTRTAHRVLQDEQVVKARQYLRGGYDQYKWKNNSYFNLVRKFEENRLDQRKKLRKQKVLLERQKNRQVFEVDDDGNVVGVVKHDLKNDEDFLDLIDMDDDGDDGGANSFKNRNDPKNKEIEKELAQYNTKYKKFNTDQKKNKKKEQEQLTVHQTFSAFLEEQLLSAAKEHAERGETRQPHEYHGQLLRRAKQQQRDFEESTFSRLSGLVWSKVGTTTGSLLSFLSPMNFNNLEQFAGGRTPYTQAAVQDIYKNNSFLRNIFGNDPTTPGSNRINFKSLTTQQDIHKMNPHDVRGQQLDMLPASLRNYLSPFSGMNNNNSSTSFKSNKDSTIHIQNERVPSKLTHISTTLQQFQQTNPVLRQKQQHKNWLEQQLLEQPLTQQLGTFFQQQKMPVLSTLFMTTNSLIQNNNNQHNVNALIKQQNKLLFDPKHHHAVKQEQEHQRQVAHNRALLQQGEELMKSQHKQLFNDPSLSLLNQTNANKTSLYPITTPTMLIDNYNAQKLQIAQLLDDAENGVATKQQQLTINPKDLPSAKLPDRVLNRERLNVLPQLAQNPEHITNFATFEKNLNLQQSKEDNLQLLNQLREEYNAARQTNRNLQQQLLAATISNENNRFSQGQSKEQIKNILKQQQLEKKKMEDLYAKVRASEDLVMAQDKYEKTLIAAHVARRAPSMQARYEKIKNSLGKRKEELDNTRADFLKQRQQRAIRQQYEQMSGVPLKGDDDPLLKLLMTPPEKNKIQNNNNNNDNKQQSDVINNIKASKSFPLYNEYTNKMVDSLEQFLSMKTKDDDNKSNLSPFNNKNNKTNKNNKNSLFSDDMIDAVLENKVAKAIDATNNAQQQQQQQQQTQQGQKQEPLLSPQEQQQFLQKQLNTISNLGSNILSLVSPFGAKKDAKQKNKTPNLDDDSTLLRMNQQMKAEQSNSPQSESSLRKAHDRPFQQQQEQAPLLPKQSGMNYQDYLRTRQQLDNLTTNLNLKGNVKFKPHNFVYEDEYEDE